MGHLLCLTHLALLTTRWTQSYPALMMTIHRISAGDGYEYYTREVATADVQRKRGQKLGDYYLKSGAPAGVWEGSAIGKHFAISGEVTEQQMRDLYGQGKRPDAQTIRDAKKGVVNERDLILGRAYDIYPALRTRFQEQVAAQSALFEQDNGHAPVGKELSDIRFGVARSLYTQDRRRSAISDAEIARFMHAQLDTQTGSVAGFDLTFSAPKSVSVLWALGDKNIQDIVEAAHTDAIKDAITWLEADVISSRAGLNGVRRVSVDGIMAARFRHYDSRAGDPQLHDHLVVSNKVFCPDPAQPDGGVWRTLDSRALYKATVATSERYNNALMTHLSQRLGISFEQRATPGTGTPKMEISFIPDTLIDRFSQRRLTIKSVLEDLEAKYIADHGHAPSRKARIALAQQATLATRTRKDHANLATRFSQWHSQATERYTSDNLAHLTGHATVGHDTTDPATLTPPAAPDHNLLVPVVLEELEKRRSTFTRRHIQAEAARVLATTTAGKHASPDQIDLLTQRVMTQAGLVRLSRPLPVLAPSLADHNDISIYEQPNSWRYTSPAIIEREDRLLTLTERQLTAPATSNTLANILATAEADGVTLGADKLLMIDTFALSDRALLTAVGPAGTGKTTAMRYVARAVQADGHTVIGLAPSAVAAKELGDSLNLEASTAQRWLAREAWRDLTPGDMVIIDEAAMMDTATLADVATMATSQGAVVRMVGDPYQLQAVEAGGAFQMLHAATAGPELEEVFRFNDHTEARASLRLRHGQEDTFTWYLEHDRIHGGSQEEATAAAFGAWCADTNAGATSIIMATDAETVRTLNDTISAHRATQGHTTTAPHTITTRDGQRLRIGDTILTRRNDTSNPYGKATFVKNGDLFTLTNTHEDGSLTVTAADGSVLSLSADYTNKHVQLGYAVTIHRAQGVTVDSAHAIVDSSAARAAAYVALTRGRNSNHLWVALDDNQPLTAALDAISGRDEDDIAAHAAHIEEQAFANDPQRARDIYQDLATRADRTRWATYLQDAVNNNTLPALLANPTASPRYINLATKLTAAQDAGLNIDTLLTELTTDLGKAKDPIALTSWRLEKWMETHPHLLHAANTNAPLAALSDSELLAKAEHAKNESETLLRRLHQMSANSHIHLADGTQPAWALRPYGNFSDQALTQHYNQVSEEIFLGITPDGDTAAAQHERLQAIQAERDLRAIMPADTLRAENDQRSAIHNLPFDERIAATTRLLAGPYTPVRPYDTIEQTIQHLVDDTRAALERTRETSAQVQAEQQRRTYTTQPPAASSDHLSTWAAPASQISDPHTPADLRQAMTTQRALLADNIRDAGQLATTEAPWAKNLKRPEGIDTRRWHTIIGEVATYRATHKVPTDTPLVATANTGAPGEQPIHNQVTYLALHTQGDNPDAIKRAQADADATGRTLDEIRNGQELHQPLPQTQEPARAEATTAPDLDRAPGWQYRVSQEELAKHVRGRFAGTEPVSTPAVATTPHHDGPTLPPPPPPTAPRYQPPQPQGPALR